MIVKVQGSGQDERIVTVNPKGSELNIGRETLNTLQRDKATMDTYGELKKNLWSH